MIDQSKNKGKQLLGSLILTFVSIIWGTGFVFQRVGMDSIEPITFTASRMTISAVAVGIVALFMKDAGASGGKGRLKDTVTGGICCGCFLVTATIFQQAGLVYTTAGKAGFITALYMLFVPVISFLIFRKRYSWLVWTAVFIGIAGMYLLCMTEGFSFAKGDDLELICAVLYSCHILCCGHFVTKGNPVRISAIQFVAASVISWILAFITETPSMDKIVSALIPIMYCGFVSGGIGYTLQIVAQKFTDPTVASLLMSLESVFAVLAGVLILHERMSMREAIGCIVMFTAIIIVQIPTSRKGIKPSGK